MKGLDNLVQRMDIKPDAQRWTELQTVLERYRQHLQRNPVPVGAADESLFYYGNYQDALPRRLIVDPILRPVEKIVWAILRTCVVHPQLPGVNPSQDEIARLANVSSRTTIATALTTLRLLGWLVTGDHRPGEDGQYRARIYLLCDQPLPLPELIALDARYPALVRRCLKHSNGHLRQIAHAIRSYLPAKASTADRDDDDDGGQPQQRQESVSSAPARQEPAAHDQKPVLPTQARTAATPCPDFVHGAEGANFAHPSPGAEIAHGEECAKFTQSPCAKIFEHDTVSCLFFNKNKNYKKQTTTASTGARTSAEPIPATDSAATPAVPAPAAEATAGKATGWTYWLPNDLARQIPTAERIRVEAELTASRPNEPLAERQQVLNEWTVQMRRATRGERAQIYAPLAFLRALIRYCEPSRAAIALDQERCRSQQASTEPDRRAAPTPPSSSRPKPDARSGELAHARRMVELFRHRLETATGHTRHAIEQGMAYWRGFIENNNQAGFV